MLVAGERRGRYVIEALLGEGGMGRVYRARDEVLRRTVALKMLQRDGTDGVGNARLLREARVAAAIEHANVVSIFDVGELDGAPFVAMEFVSGRSLRSLVGDAAIGTRTKLRWLADLARALAAGHRKGLVHRDVKPENVMVRDDGTLKLLDYGIARPSDAPDETAGIGLAMTGEGLIMTGSETVDPAVTRPHRSIAGTPLYMAPEQITGEPLDGRTDQFAWGVVAFELLVGYVPWKAKTASALFAEIVSTDVEVTGPMADASAVVIAIVRRALARAPADRYASMAALLEDLEGVVANDAPKALEVADTHAAPDRALTPGSGPGASQPPNVTAAGPTRHYAWPMLAVLGVGAIALVSMKALETKPAALTPSRAPSTGPSACLDAPLRRFADVCPGEITNPEAIAAFRAGLQAMRDGAWVRVEAPLAKAVQLEPTFGAVWLRLIFSRRQSGTEESRREAFREAIRFRSTLTERDRVLLDALTPSMEGPGGKERTLTALRSAAARYPGDLEITLWIMFEVFLDVPPDELLALTREGLSTDPEALDFLQFEGIALASLGRIGEALTSFDHAVARAPDSDSLWTKAFVEMEVGRCRDAERDARAAVVHTGNLALAPMQAALMFANGTERAAVEQTLQQGLSGPVLALVPVAIDRASIAIATGDFAGGERLLRQAIAGAGDVWVEHLFSTRALVQVLVETGRVQEAARAAEAFRKGSGAWKAAPALSYWDDLSLTFAAAEVRGGTLTRDAFVSMREAWLAKGREVTRGLTQGQLWITAYAAPAGTPDEAREALRALEGFPAVPPGAVNYASFSVSATRRAAIANVRFLAGDDNGALPLLREAAADCSALVSPVTSVRAHHDLAVVLERTGDKDGACKEHKLVVERWGAGKPPTLSATDSKKRMTTLHCP